jgi:hypothetical protein
MALARALSATTYTEGLKVLQRLAAMLEDPSLKPYSSRRAGQASQDERTADDLPAFMAAGWHIQRDDTGGFSHCTFLGWWWSAPTGSWVSGERVRVRMRMRGGG